MDGTSINIEMPAHAGKPLITVAMPVFNGGPFLESAVASIVWQTYPNWQLILVDDGSTDGAIDALPMLSDPRILVFRDGRNLGLATRLNQIIDLAKGDLIARMDGDDISHPERFARQIHALNKNPNVDLVATGCRTMSRSGRLLGNLPFVGSHEKICAAPWRGFYMPHPTWMGRINWFRRHYYADPAPYCCEDQEMLLRSYRNSTFMAIPDELLDYRLKDSIAWRKAWHTRSALWNVQVRQFITQRQYGLIARATITRLGRHLKDTLIWVSKVQKNTVELD